MDERDLEKAVKRAGNRFVKREPVSLDKGNEIRLSPGGWLPPPEIRQLHS